MRRKDDEWMDGNEYNTTKKGYVLEYSVANVCFMHIVEQNTKDKQYSNRCCL